MFCDNSLATFRLCVGYSATCVWFYTYAHLAKSLRHPFLETFFHHQIFHKSRKCLTTMAQVSFYLLLCLRIFWSISVVHSQGYCGTACQEPTCQERTTLSNSSQSYSYFMSSIRPIIVQAYCRLCCRLRSDFDSLKGKYIDCDDIVRMLNSMYSIWCVSLSFSLLLFPAGLNFWLPLIQSFLLSFLAILGRTVDYSL